MKTIQSAVMLLCLGLLGACSQQNEVSKQIEGQWKLTSFTNDGVSIDLTDCDTQTIWDFTSETGEPLGDGTEVQLLTATAPEECQYYGFDAKWTIADGQLFISTSRIGGMGGNSLAGLLKVTELEENSMSLQMGSKSLKFVR